MKQRTPLEESRHRESKLADGLRLLADIHGVKFKEPLHIDSNGEFSIVALGDEPPFCGNYGEPLAKLLNKHGPRCGIRAMRPGYLLPESGWCMMNHFDVERMLEDFVLPDDTRTAREEEEIESARSENRY